jgi:hypothetical protein
MERLLAEDTRDRALDPAEEHAPGSKVARCRFNGVFLSAGSIILFEFKWRSLIWSNWKRFHRGAK